MFALILKCFFVTSNKIGKMKKWLISTFLVVGLQLTTNAQLVYSVDAEYKADVKVYVVDAEYKADLLVFKENAEYKAGNNDGKWYFVNAEYKAKKKIYFVDAEYKAELKIYFVDAAYKAGWKNSSKKAEMY